MERNDIAITELTNYNIRKARNLNFSNVFLTFLEYFLQVQHNSLLKFPDLQKVQNIANEPKTIVLYFRLIYSFEKCNIFKNHEKKRPETVEHQENNRNTWKTSGNLWPTCKTRGKLEHKQLKTFDPDEKQEKNLEKQLKNLGPT